MKLSKNTDLDKYKYTGCRIGFDSRGKYFLPDGSIGKNVIVFGVDMSWSVHLNNKGKDIVILGKGPTHGLGGTTFTAEVLYPINFKESRERFLLLSLRYNGSNSFLFVNDTNVYKFKVKDSKIKDYALCLSKVSKDFTINNMNKTGLKGVVIFFPLILILLIIAMF